MRSYLLLFVVVLAFPNHAVAHSGGLDKNGCHTNRKTGDYHCHRDSPTSQSDSLAPADSLSPAKPTRRAGEFANCDEARAAGAAPVRRGDSGYGTHLDRDNDGIGCE